MAISLIQCTPLDRPFENGLSEIDSALSLDFFKYHISTVMRVHKQEKEQCNVHHHSGQWQNNFSFVDEQSFRQSIRCHIEGNGIPSRYRYDSLNCVSFK